MVNIAQLYYQLLKKQVMMRDMDPADRDIDVLRESPPPAKFVKR